MMNLKKTVTIVSVVATVAFLARLQAQDDLDALINDLEEDVAEAPAAEVAEAAPTEEPKAVAEEATPQEEAPAAATEEAEPEAEAPAAEEPAEEPAEVAEEAAPAATPAEESAAEPAEEPTDESAEAAEEAEPEEAAPVATPAEEPAAEEVVDEEPIAEAKEAPAPAPAVANKGADDVLSLLDELASESGEVEDAAPEKSVAQGGESKPGEVAEVPAPVAPAVTRPAHPDAALLADVRALEIVRRQGERQYANDEIKRARACMQAQDYLNAVRHYANAEKRLGQSGEEDDARRECRQGMTEGLYQAALQENRIGRYDRASKLIEKAIDMRHPLARRQQEKWIAEGKMREEKIDLSDITHRRNEQGYRAQRKKTLAHLKRANQYLATRELSKALDECELVLVDEPYNSEALRLRRVIQQKRRTIAETEREAMRKGMMADVDDAWRPVYAVNAREVDDKNAQTVKRETGPDPERSQEQSIIARMKKMRLPQISFKPPATLIDAVEFFRTASRDYDDPSIMLEKRGFNFVLKLPEAIQTQQATEEEEGGGFGAEDTTESASNSAVPVIPIITASDISFYEALKLVCDSVGYKFKVQGPIVMVMHKSASTDEMVTRSYPVLSTFMERMDTASNDMKELKTGFGSNMGRQNANDDEGENQERDWKEFFRLLGVQWPEGSSIMYIKAIGKLRVRNTYENLAELEQALTEMNAAPKLIEIEARFVEVCQDDLNSLGFEWILNSDYSIGLNKHIAKALGIRGGGFAEASSGTGDGGAINTPNAPWLNNGEWNGQKPGYGDQVTDGGTSSASGWKNQGGNRNIGLNAMGGESDYGMANRFLSQTGNHVSGEGGSTNDRFMRLNAFLGSADLSMILHMLAQRSDTDLLSAPKVLTRPGEEAVIKVVTEYIYPTDYDVQLQSSSSGGGGGSYGGSSQSAILAVVEPQSFVTREVGVILDVTPTLTDDGNLIDLKLNTQVVDEPTWKNYGMRIPFTGNSSMQSFAGIGEIFTGLSDVLTSIGETIDPNIKTVFATQATDAATSALANLSSSSKDNITYYDAPMEQPFFHVRSIDSSVSVYPGATIVMGGLITEQRKAMDDKVPFLGDIPFIGRFFRSHSELSSKRNLLIFVTTRLVDVQGREVTVGSTTTQKDETVQAAPEVAE